MKKIPLTRGMEAIVDDEDFGWLSEFKWCLSGSGYAVKSGGVYMHRLIAKAKQGEFVDHINLNKLDNRRENLRICTKQQNQWNQQSRSGTSQYKGVSLRTDTGKYSAQITYNRRKINLGCFETEEHAALAYNAAATYYHGAFAKLNDITRSARKRA